MKVGKETEIYNNGYADGYEAAMRLEIPDPDYWTRLEHTYAGMAMQGILSNPESELDYKGDDTLPQALAACVAKLAHTLVEKLKKKEERK